MATNTKVSTIGSHVYALWPLKIDCHTDFDLQLAALDAGRGEAREVAVAMSNKLSFLLYPMLLKTPASYDDAMEIVAKQISAYFVTLEFLNMQGIWYRN
jgi:FtsZ-interacting cell division protein YlmF